MRKFDTEGIVLYNQWGKERLTQILSLDKEKRIL